MEIDRGMPLKSLPPLITPVQILAEQRKKKTWIVRGSELYDGRAGAEIRPSLQALVNVTAVHPCALLLEQVIVQPSKIDVFLSRATLGGVPRLSIPSFGR